MPGVELYEKGPLVANSQVSLLDIPACIGATPDAFDWSKPYLTAPQLQALPPRTGDAPLRVGLVGRATPSMPTTPTRSCPVEHFIRLAAQTNVAFPCRLRLR
jgi:hypothetical protein